MTCSRLLDDRHHWALAHGCVVFGDDRHQSTHYQAKNDGIEHVHVGKLVSTDDECLRKHVLHNKERSDTSKHDGRPVTHIQGFLYVAVIIFDRHKSHTHNGEDDA